jgi:hypothetical protein
MKLLILLFAPFSGHFSPLGPHILLSIPLSKPLRLLSPFNVRDQVYNPVRHRVKFS